MVGERVGWDSFVANPMLTPDPKWFPDAWSPDRRGVRRLATRILRYAGLEHEVAVEVEPPPEEGVVAWFSGIDEGACKFGIDPAQLAHEDTFVAALCHEACHAFRRHHGIELTNHDREEEATDLTSVFLGFGVYALNGSDQFDARGELIGTMVRTHFHVQRLGYLSPVSLAYLLAVQVVVRELSPKARRRFASYLRANQRASFEAALEELRDKAAFLRDRLRMPDRSTWPEPRTEPITIVLEDEEPPSAPEPVSAKTRRNRGAWSVRMMRSAGATWMVAGGGLGMLLGVWSSGSVPAGGAQIVTVVVMVAAFGYVGLRLGRGWRADECSACEARVPLHADTCPACGVELVGEVADAEERLLFEEVVAEQGIAAAVATCGAARREKTAKGRVLILKIALAIAAALALAFLVGWGRPSLRARSRRCHTCGR